MTPPVSWAGGGGAWSVVVHGGAGNVPPERRQSHADGCRAAARAAAEILAAGDGALDAVQRAVRILEDDPRFNAGTGACLTSEGHLELDAAIMEGSSLRAGAVCSLGPFRNPIEIARAVLEQGDHVLYAGAGADRVARALGFEPAEEETMITEASRRKLAAALAKGSAESWAGSTVGAVARDASGVVAAASSTGGTAATRPGRVGDTPILGAGTYADDRVGAAAATGLGEAILRVALATRGLARIERGDPPDAAARACLVDLLARTGGRAGIVLSDAGGRLGLARTTETMSWAAEWAGSNVASGF